MPDKLILKIYPTQPNESGVIRIDQTAYKLLEQIQKETGLSVKHIASEFIKFGSERYEVKEVK